MYWHEVVELVGPCEFIWPGQSNCGQVYLPGATRRLTYRISRVLVDPAYIYMCLFFYTFVSSRAVQLFSQIFLFAKRTVVQNNYLWQDGIINDSVCVTNVAQEME